ncbi:ABC transporter ATP-binding protein [Actinomycetes bacterium]|jgi:ABC-type branched-subunit amino acid transport system ATPase component|nr:ABC transporter ATP-binding protein [Actinomycetes bacterium]
MVADRTYSETARVARAALASVEATPGVKKPDSILSVDGVRRHFGGIVAVDVKHLEVQRGSITALIGPNGAGKTTLFNLLSGFDTPDVGEWRFDGHNMSRVVAHKTASMGMVRTFQLTKSLTKMSVIENMKLGAMHQAGEKWWNGLFPFVWKSQEKKIEERADALLTRFKMDHMRNEYAGTLSGGQRKLLEMARALMTQPRLVMLDEPMAGVNPALKQSLNEHIRGLRDDGMTVLFVEHDMDMVNDVADWVVVMAEGMLIAEGTPEQIGNNPQVIEAYLGSHQGKSLLEEKS